MSKENCTALTPSLMIDPNRSIASQAAAFLRAVALSCAATLAGCSPAPVVTIANQAPVGLANVVVSGTGFSRSVGNIAPGAQAVVAVSPRGESGLRIAFDAAGRHIESGDLAYLENNGGYRVAVTVAPDLRVAAHTEIKGY